MSIEGVGVGVVWAATKRHANVSKRIKIKDTHKQKHTMKKRGTKWGYIQLYCLTQALLRFFWNFQLGAKVYVIKMLTRVFSCFGCCCCCFSFLPFHSSPLRCTCIFLHLIVSLCSFVLSFSYSAVGLSCFKLHRTQICWCILYHVVNFVEWRWW